MSSLLLELVPFALGLAITPAAIATGILFLSSHRPVANALAFAAPFALVYTGVAAVVLGAAEAATDPLVNERGKHIASLILGLLLLAGAAVMALRHRATAPPTGASKKAGWLAGIETASPRRAFGVGLVLAVLNPNMPILLGGLATIAAAEVSTGGRVGGAVFLVVAAEAGLVGPILWYVADAERAARGLAWMRGWLSRHEQSVDLGVLVVFGALFVLKGIAGL